MTDDARKQAEVDYPIAIGEEGQRWLQTKPFANEPRETARLLIDFGYVVQLLELRPGMSLVELGCGPGWMTRFAARHGLEAAGYDIAPKMIEIAREAAAAEGVDATFEVGDMETLDLGHRYDTALVYDAVHHTPRADLVFAAAHRALKPGGRLVLVEYRAGDPKVPIKPLHTMTEAQVRKEAAVHPLEWLKTEGNLPRQHVIVFRKK